MSLAFPGFLCFSAVFAVNCENSSSANIFSAFFSRFHESRTVILGRVVVCAADLMRGSNAPEFPMIFRDFCGFAVNEFVEIQSIPSASIAVNCIESGPIAT